MEAGGHYEKDGDVETWVWDKPEDKADKAEPEEEPKPKTRRKKAE